MGQANINVSIDGKGNLVCDDIDGWMGESITWVPDANTILSIQSISPTVGSFNPAPSASNNWTGNVATEGSFRSGGMGVEYTITVNPRNAASGQKTKTPKIRMLTEELKVK